MTSQWTDESIKPVRLNTASQHTSAACFLQPPGLALTWWSHVLSYCCRLSCRSPHDVVVAVDGRPVSGPAQVSRVAHHGAAQAPCGIPRAVGRPSGNHLRHTDTTRPGRFRFTILCSILQYKLNFAAQRENNKKKTDPNWESDCENRDLSIAVMVMSPDTGVGYRICTCKIQANSNPSYYYKLFMYLFND